MNILPSAKITSKASFGFTLIELLIVVALLGVLAMGLLAAIDPIEQVRRGRDTALRDAAAQFYQAQQRNYANKGSFTQTFGVTGNTLNNYVGDINALIAAGELKSQYATQVTGANATRGQAIHISSDVAGTTLTACFNPESKAFTTATENNRTSVGAAGCVESANNQCWTCIQ